MLLYACDTSVCAYDKYLLVEWIMLPSKTMVSGETQLPLGATTVVRSDPTGTRALPAKLGCIVYVTACRVERGATGRL